jgi:NAD(P)H-flavin reductase
MATETLTIQELRPEGNLAFHVTFAGGSKALAASYDRPGMRVAVTVGDLEAEVALASPPGEPFAVLLERATPLGEAMAALQVGASVQVSEALGWGVPLSSHEGLDLYLLGNGAGLGPVRAVALAALAVPGRFKSVHVLTEAHFLNELPYREEYPAWQRAGAIVYQLMQRPDMGKWREAEAAYIYEQLVDIGPDPDNSVVFAAGPDGLLSGTAGVLRRIDFDPSKLYLFELETVAPQRADEAERPADILGKISTEGVYGSGHQCDVPDHGPVIETPSEQPKAAGLPPYKRAKELSQRGH